MLEIYSQPIVNVLTNEKVMEERLSRPGCNIKEYFSTKDRNTLLRRELHAILQSIEEYSYAPYNLNVTLYTLPTLSRLPLSWNGGIEIVEWEKSILPFFKEIRNAISSFQARGMSVWADDVTAATISMWLKTGVNGFKVEIDEIRNNESFIEYLQTSKRPIIVERIETYEDHVFIKERGISLAQGFYYGKPEKISKEDAVQASQPILECRI